MRGFGMIPKRNKYGANKCEYDGKVFDSKLEKNRYIFLKDAESKGAIRDLQCQVQWELLPKQCVDVVKHLKTKDKIVQQTLFHKVVYTCDFAYTKADTGEYVVEDCKGSKLLLSRDFPLREKMMYYFHKIKIRIVTKATEQI